MTASIQLGPQAALAAEQQQYLTFMLGQEMFAVGILNIREIIEFGGLTTVPMMPRFVRGVINLRGAVVPVIDLAARFGREPAPVTRRSCTVIVELAADSGEQRQQLGLMVDSVSAVVEIPQHMIEPAPAFGSKVRADFIKGMGKVAEKFVIVLDIDSVLAIDEMASLTAAVQAVQAVQGA